MDYDKICEHCGQKYDTLAEMQAHTSGPECLRRQLAAANERAEKLEAQMVELRELWEIIDSGVKPKPHCEDEVGGAALAIKRILGGV